MVQPDIRKVVIWVSGLLASAIPFIFVGAVIAFLACVFDAVGEHAPTVRSKAAIQAEATAPQQVVAVASVDASDHRQAGKQDGGNAPDHHARRSRSHSRVRHTPVVNGKIAPLSQPRFANHFANQSTGIWHKWAVW